MELAPMAADPALTAFLALPVSGTDHAVAAFADARAEALGLDLPQACRAGVLENLSLLRRQAAVFMADRPAGDAPEAFTP